MADDLIDTIRENAQGPAEATRASSSRRRAARLPRGSEATGPLGNPVNPTTLTRARRVSACAAQARKGPFERGGYGDPPCKTPT